MPAELQASHGPVHAPNSSSSGATEGAFGGRSPDSGSKNHVPRNVQVDLVESQGGSIIRLTDAGGAFLEVVPGDSGGGDGSVARTEKKAEQRTRKLEERSRKRKLGKVVEVHRRGRVSRLTGKPISGGRRWRWL